MPILAAAVIGQSNQPLYLEAFRPESEEDPLKFHYIIHCSLDAVEEKLAQPKKLPTDQGSPYLGMLYPTEDYKVFGYVSNTKMKFILVLDEPIPKPEEMKTTISSPSFDASVRTILTTI